jgi:hypothetical protein
MAKTKTPAPIDTTLGTAAYNLAVQYQTALNPRLPAGMIATLGADLTTLGAAPAAPAVTTPASPTPAPTTPAATPPTLAEAVASATGLITAMHAAIAGAKPNAAVRKAYRVSSKAEKAPKHVIADGTAIVTQAKSDPTEALSLGILPADVTALAAALAAVQAAEIVVKGSTGGAATGKERHAAEVRMHEAVARIAGAGVLAFATSPTVRAEFAALAVKKKV